MAEGSLSVAETSTIVGVKWEDFCVVGRILLFDNRSLKESPCDSLTSTNSDNIHQTRAKRTKSSVDLSSTVKCKSSSRQETHETVQRRWGK